MDLDSAVAAWVLGQLSPGHVQQFAWDGQAAGYDGPALRTLAAYEWSTWRDVNDLFEQAVREMGLRVPTRDEAARLLARNIAAAITSGERDPYDGAGELAALYFAAGYAGFLSDFVVLADSYDVFPDRRAGINREIVAAATALLHKVARAGHRQSAQPHG